jgi:hypothetical protein
MMPAASTALRLILGAWLLQSQSRMNCCIHSAPVFTIRPDKNITRTRMVHQVPNKAQAIKPRVAAAPV